MRPRAAGSSSPSPAGALARLGGFVVLIGVLAGVAAVPVGSLVGTATAYWSGRQRAGLPRPLLDPMTAQSTRVYADDGRSLIATFFDEDRHDVTLAQVAPVMRQAVVAAEDARFYQHGGVDVRGALRALVADYRNGRAAQGASTLTMQLIRNVFKEDPRFSAAQRRAATADTLWRKLRETRYAIELEHHLTKQQILQDYLNIVYFGDGAYGIEAASRRVFGVPPARLDLAEAALIAGMLQSPEQDNPISGNPARARTRQLYVLTAMARAGFITLAQRAAAAAEKLSFAGAKPVTGCLGAGGASDGWGFFCDYLRRWWDAQPAFGRTVGQRDDALRRGGYTIVTTLDPRVQHAAEQQSRSVYPPGDRRALPIAAVEPGSGKVLALAVNRRYGIGRSRAETVVPLVSGGGEVYGYPAGSTFKLFTMLAALRAGLPLNTGFDAPARVVTHWPDTGPHGCAGRYCPGNANPAWMDGFRTMWTAFGRSVNTYFVHLEERVGPAAAVAQARALGISFAAPADARMAGAGAGARSWGAFTLGVVDTTPLELASAYATLAADGEYCAPRPVQSITDARHLAVPVAGRCRRAIPPEVARAATDAARCPVGEQSAYRKCDGATAAQAEKIFHGRPVAGKTGSTEDNTTETFVGFTPVAAVAGIANDPDSPADHVGSAVESRVVIAVGRTLRVATGDGGYPDFAPPSRAMAFGGGTRF
jgi:membrane peptidoglycan carboxypeptidase